MGFMRRVRLALRVLERVEWMVGEWREGVGGDEAWRVARLIRRVGELDYILGRAQGGGG